MDPKNVLGALFPGLPWCGPGFFGGLEAGGGEVISEVKRTRKSARRSYL